MWLGKAASKGHEGNFRAGIKTQHLLGIQVQYNIYHKIKYINEQFTIHNKLLKIKIFKVSIEEQSHLADRLVQAVVCAMRICMQ